MLLVREILGDVDESRFAGRRVELVLINSADATKRRLRSSTNAGTDIAIDLPRGSYLRHGAVLAADDSRIVVIERKPEDAMVVRLSSVLAPGELLCEALRLGHAFGNQHVPLEVEGGEIHIPITTSREIAAHTVGSLNLNGAEVTFRLVQFAKDHPLQPTGHGNN
jgi:urease accessory protein